MTAEYRGLNFPLFTPSSLVPSPLSFVRKPCVLVLTSQALNYVFLVTADFQIRDDGSERGNEVSLADC